MTPNNSLFSEHPTQPQWPQHKGGNSQGMESRRHRQSNLSYRRVKQGGALRERPLLLQK